MRSQKSNSTKPLSLTVGITTCYGDPSILDTIKSIRASKNVDKFRLIVVADRVPFSAKVKNQLKKYDVELIENLVVVGQVPKKKQIISSTTSDILIFTQDDVLFEPITISSILSRFAKHPETKLISIRKQPVPAAGFFEDIAGVGTSIINRIARSWNHGDNYLAIVGRCMAIRTAWVKKYKIPDVVVSSDAYFYLENKRLGGRFEYLPETAVLYRKPNTLSEHQRKSSRFQFQHYEMTKYFGDVTPYYKIPKLLLLKALVAEFASAPVKTILYLCIYAYTHLFRQNMQASLNAVWEVDPSTKKVITASGI